MIIIHFHWVNTPNQYFDKSYISIPCPAPVTKALLPENSISISKFVFYECVLSIFVKMECVLTLMMYSYIGHGHNTAKHIPQLSVLYHLQKSEGCALKKYSP